EDLMDFGNVPPTGAAGGTDCTAIRGWVADADVPNTPLTVRFVFGGALGDAGTVVVEQLADLYDATSCLEFGPCEHGFSLEVPMSLRDGSAHSVRFYAQDDEGGAWTE